MSLTSRIIGQLLKLPPAETHRFTITHDLSVPMPDGVTLFADHYTPRSSATATNYPTILVRSPYGRRGFFAYIFAVPYVERGYQVLIQSCRGTAGSGGDFVYARNEHQDGLATIAWIKQQPWFNGELAMLGPSYLGFVQWAIAKDAGADIKAMIPSITTADFNSFRFQGGTMTLENMLGWSSMMTMQAATGPRLRDAFSQRTRRLEHAYLHLPLNEADQVAIRQRSNIYQETLAHGPDDAYWQPVDFSAQVSEITTPICLQAGWYDLFLDWQLKDYQVLSDAGRQPHLLIGPWYHGQMTSISTMTRDGLAWLDATVKGKKDALRERPVRLFVMGSDTWRDFEDWPPPAVSQRWYLQPNRALIPVTPPVTEPDRYHYDPADPTPAVGGNSLGAQKRMGAKDNRTLEARPDVLVYTSAVLEQDMEVIGSVTADLYVRSSLDYTDFFARLCVVEQSGKSVNLCDGILRLTLEHPASDGDGIRHIQVALWPTAYHFRRGQRIRVQISSGAHPRFARNPGTGEPPATASKLLAADQEVYHDPEHPSAILLPVLES